MAAAAADVSVVGVADASVAGAGAGAVSAGFVAAAGGFYLSNK